MANPTNETDIRKLVKDTYPRLFDEDVDLYIHECERRGVDPTSRLIVPRPNIKKSGSGWERGGPPAWITTIDLMRARADETGTYAPGSATQYEMDNGHLVRATVHVRKLVANQFIEFAESADWQEFYPGEGVQGNVWRAMPKVMLAKVAEARALRRGWPAQLQGLYEGAEMDQADKLPPPPAQRAVVDGPTYEPVDNAPPVTVAKPASTSKPAPRKPTMSPQRIKLKSAMEAWGIPKDEWANAVGSIAMKINEDRSISLGEPDDQGRYSDDQCGLMAEWIGDQMSRDVTFEMAMQPAL